MNKVLSENRHLVFAVLGIAIGFVFGFRLAHKQQPLALQYNTPIIPYEQTVKSTKMLDDSVETDSKVVVSEPENTKEITPQKDCAVKGNPTSKIYHIPGGAFYEKMKSPECFASEEAAKKAGYRRSGR